MQLGGFLGKLLGPILRNKIKPLAKSVLIPLELTAATEPVDPEINEKNLASGPTKSIISNKEMGNVMKIVKYLEESGLLINSSSENNWIWSKRTRRSIS